MKQEISSLELHYLVDELKALENTKVDRIYHSKESKNELVIALHKSGEGKRFLRAQLPGKIFIQEYKSEQQTPTGLCMMLRKYLEGAILREISQAGFERALTLKFETRTEGKKSSYILIIELFSKGNIIFCDDEHKILNLLEEQHWKDRELKKDSIYIYPKSKYDTLELGEQRFIDIIKGSPKESIVKALAIELNLGGIYAEELCMDIDKSQKPGDIDEKTLSLLYKRFKDLFNRKHQANKADGNILPFILESSKTGTIHYQSFNEAIAQNNNIEIDKARVEREKQISKLRLIIDDQNSNLIDCENNYKENQDKAGYIYSHYREIDEMLKTLNKIRENHSWKDIKDKISKDEIFKRIIKDIDEKNNQITIEFNDK